MEMTRKERAKSFALRAHGDQKYGEFPYSYHLERVVSVLVRFGKDTEELVCAAWMHDVVEDTEFSREDVAERFGEDVANLVFCVTYEDGKNRVERAEKTYPKMSACRDAVVLKLADRIANVEEGIRSGSSLVKMYRKEYADFRNALYESGHAEEMWSHLDSLLA